MIETKGYKAYKKIGLITESICTIMLALYTNLIFYSNVTLILFVINRDTRLVGFMSIFREDES